MGLVAAARGQVQTNDVFSNDCYSE